MLIKPQVGLPKKYSAEMSLSIDGKKQAKLVYGELRTLKNIAESKGINQFSINDTLKARHTWLVNFIKKTCVNLDAQENDEFWTSYNNERQRLKDNEFRSQAIELKEDRFK